MLVPNYEATLLLLDTCYRKGVKRVIIEYSHIYAWPCSAEIYKKSRRSYNIILWDAMSLVDSKFRPNERYRTMKCGNGQMTRGDECSYECSKIAFVQGVYFDGHTPRWAVDLEASVVKHIEARLLGIEMVLEPPVCPHGDKTTCHKKCFQNWGEFGR